MSASPPKEADVEQGDPTPENSEPMDRGDTESGARELAFNDFDVKEQDRWLPIANGWLLNTLLTVLSSCEHHQASGARHGEIHLRPTSAPRAKSRRTQKSHSTRCDSHWSFSFESSRSAHPKALVVSLPHPFGSFLLHQPVGSSHSCPATPRSQYLMRVEAPRAAPQNHTLSPMLTFVTLHQWPGS